MFDYFDEGEKEHTHYAGDQIPWSIKLCVAVLRRAIVDFKLYKGHVSTKLSKVGDEAGEWLFVDDHTPNLMTFVSICDIIGIHPTIIRTKIDKLTEEQVRRLRGMEFGDDA